MTAPIQEPNLYRHASGLQWGQNQLFRRPPPANANIIPMLRAISDSAWAITPITVPDNSEVPLDFKYWQISDTSVFDETGFSPGGDLRIFRGLVRGLYHVKAVVHLDFGSAVPFVDLTITLFVEQVGGGSAGSMWSFNEQYVHGRGVDHGEAAYIFDELVSVPPFDPDGTAIDPSDPPTGWDGNLEIEIDTSDSSSVDMDYARLEVFYLGPIDWEATTQS
jgi:hypothetical protein